MEITCGYIGVSTIFILLPFVTGDQLMITTQPAAFVPLLTPSLTIRCSVNTSLNSSSALVGRSANKRQQPGSDGDSKTSVDLSVVSSLIITKDGVDLSSVTEQSPPRAFGAWQSSDVTGSVSPGGGARAVLQMKISNPGPDTTGRYTCQAAGYDDVGHVATAHVAADVASVTPTLQDVINALYTSELTHQGELAQLKADNSVKLAQLEAKYTSQLANLTVELQTQEATIASLSATLGGGSHTESGIVDCGSVARHPTYVDRRTSFKTTYPAPPIVHVALLDARFLADTTAGFKVTVSSVDETGFTVRCSSDSPSYYTGLLRVSWLSLP